MKLKSVKTLLLGLAVIFISFTVFVALPGVIPPFGQIDSDTVMWACSMRGKPVFYDNWFWYSDEQPDAGTIEKASRDVVTTEGILFGLKKSFFRGGLGILKITTDSENKNLILVSGYLQYGSFAESEIDTDVLSLPVPELLGTMGKRIITVTLTDIYENERIETEHVLLTDNDGFFSITLEPDTESRCYRIEVGFEEEINVPEDPKAPMTMYSGSAVVYVTCVEDIEFKIKRVPWWVWVLLGTATTAVIIGLYWYYTNNRRRHIPENMDIPSPEENIIAERAMIKVQETGGDTSEVTIRFPDIKESLPSVWEAIVTLKVHITFKNRSGFLPGEIGFGDGDIIQATTDESGSILISHVYVVKGDYTIKAGYKEKAGKKFSSWQKIRIVDYREEMVRLFGEMLDSLNMADLKIEPDMTPREVERLLIEKLEGVSKESIRKVIDGFEEANYSTHPVNRDSYVRMYRAIRDLTGIKL